MQPADQPTLSLVYYEETYVSLSPLQLRILKGCSETIHIYDFTLDKTNSQYPLLNNKANPSTLLSARLRRGIAASSLRGVGEKGGGRWGGEGRDGEGGGEGSVEGSWGVGS